MQFIRRLTQETFTSLGVRNFRLFILGQVISLCGTWMQTIAVSWLVLTLTHSGSQLGLVLAAQFLPILIFGVWGGIIADKFHKRYILLGTQTLSGLLALTLGILVLSHSIHLWMVYVLAACLGLVNSVDNPTRQSFVIEMVGHKQLRNAVAFNSTMVNVARIVGPSIAGVFIATVGTGVCFVANGVSYIAVITALVMMRESELHPAIPAKKAAGQIKAGLRYVWHEPTLKATLIMMFIVGTFAYEFPVIFPLFATYTLHGDASTYSYMMAASGVGAIMGGLYTARRAATEVSQLVRATILFGLSLLVLAVTPNLVSVIFVMVLVGGLSIIFIALGNTTLQLTSDPGMRGRVMSLWSIAFLGTTPIGGPIIGYISDHSSPRIGVAVGGVSALLAGLAGYLIYRRRDVINSARL